MSGRHAASDPAQAGAADIRIVAGSPSDEELAAVVAVLTTSLDALASENREQLDAAEARPGAWRRSQRAPRRGVTLGAWRTFGR